MSPPTHHTPTDPIAIAPSLIKYAILLTFGLLMVALTLIGCGGPGHAPTLPGRKPPASASAAQAQLGAFYREWHGVPYRHGGLSTAGVDCSGLTSLIYRDIFGIGLPRTTTAQARYGRSIDRDQLLPGDLLVFRTGFFQKHVGVFWRDDRFIHASTSHGVTASRLNAAYWRDHFITARRFYDFPF